MRVPMTARRRHRRGSRAMTSAYEIDLDRNEANYPPLTPVSLIARAAFVYPNHPAVIHGARRYTWAETYARARRLASALRRAGIGNGDTVAVMAANTPEMVEAHFGVPLSVSLPKTLTNRLDHQAISFMCQHDAARLCI